MNQINAKGLLGLAAVAVVAVIAAIFVASARQPENDPTPTAAFAMPELRGHINDVKGITLTGAEDKPLVTLIHGENGWTVKEKGGYSADTGKLRELLLKMAEAGLLEPKTESDKRYPELGVEDVTAKDAKGILVDLDGLQKPARLIVGKVSAQGNGTFVRHPGNKQSWLAKGTLRIERDPAQWLDQALTDIPSERIAEIVLTKSDGKPLRLFKADPDDETFTVADLPSGREIEDHATLGGLASTLAGLTLADVLPEASAQAPAKDQLIKARYTTFDGVTLDVQAWKQDGKHLARFSAALNQAVAEARIQAEQAKAKADHEAGRKQDAEENAQESAESGAEIPESAAPAVTDPAKDRQQRLDALNQEVEKLNQRFRNWTFVVPEFKYANMDKSLEDVLKPSTKTETAHSKPQAGKSGKH